MSLLELQRALRQLRCSGTTQDNSTSNRVLLREKLSRDAGPGVERGGVGSDSPDQDRHHYTLTYLFVAHDLSVVRHISDRVAVMYVGRIVELAETEDLFTAPKHPYTAALLSAVPEPDPRPRSRRIILQGEVANPASPPGGGYFHPRCPHAIEVCRTQAPAWQEIAPARFVACHRAQEFELAGVE